MNMPPKASQPIARPSEQQEQRAETQSMETSHETRQMEDTSFPPPQLEEAEAMDTRQAEFAIADDNDQGPIAVDTATQSSLVATVGSVEAEDEPRTDTVDSSKPMSPLRKYLMGDLTMDSYIDMFNVLSAVASRYVDPEGTFVRKLSLDNYPFQLRARVGTYGPIIVLVNAEIEQAIATMAGDLTSVGRVFPSDKGIDWVKLQYYLSLMQHQAPSGWTAPGFRRGGRYPKSVQNICQNLIRHDAFDKCHTTLIKEWHKVNHMLTLKRDAETSKTYSHEAIKAFHEYNKLAVSNAAEFETETLHDIYDNEEKWLPMVNDTLEIMRSSANIGNLPTGELEELERQSRRAEDELLRSEQDDLDAVERRRQKKKDKRRSGLTRSMFRYLPL